MPSTVLGSDDITVNQIYRNSCPQRAYILLRETDDKQTS